MDSLSTPGVLNAIHELENTIRKEVEKKVEKEKDQEIKRLMEENKRLMEENIRHTEEKKKIRSKNHKAVELIKKQEQEIIDLKAPRAIKNYEEHFKLPDGTATIEQVQGSSAGVDGWFRTTWKEGEQKKKKKKQKKKTTHSMTGYNWFGKKEKNTINTERERLNILGKPNGEEQLRFVTVQGKLWKGMTKEQQQKYIDEAKLVAMEQNV